MTDVWVVNASPLIALARIDRLDILSNAGRELLLPDAVVEEIVNGPSWDKARCALVSGWGPKPIQVEPAWNILEWGLGAGESAVLSLAGQHNAWAVVDDRAARIACKALSIRCIGTLGIVLRAHREGRISSAVALLKALKEAGLYLDDAVICAALLKTTGEPWPDKSTKEPGASG